MKKMKRSLIYTLLLLFVPIVAQAQSVNLTPWPKSITTGNGVFVFPKTFNINTINLDAAQMTEVKSFAADFSNATGLTATVASDDSAPVNVLYSSSVTDPEGYNLTITSSKISLQASTAVGVFYGLQSLKKMMPGNVMLGIYKPGEYSVPVVTIKDAPRFKYRGFMLDVSRHFFDVNEVKKILRLMSYYKMNFFHWHLTDDQGWRVQIDKYPKLTTVGATRSNSWNSSLKYGQYWTNSQYGPYFYTKDEIRDVVAYAEKLHITIVPEVDMPGHMCAAIAAYPEYSCTPNGNHSVQISGGVYNDVLNVANEGTVQFCKDVITELAELFPGERFNIGGDECPTTAWENNAECQAKVSSLGLSNYRQLQSIFIKEMSDHLVSLGKKVSVWNEAITAGNANTDLVAQTGAIVYCWNPTANSAAKAKNLGLQCIITPWETNASYYINRKANTQDYGAGYGQADNLKIMYNYQPIDNGVTYGVQGTFWCEHVSDVDHLEHLALPRLMGIAESGWTPLASKNFNQFVNRMKQDTAMLRMGGYNYHPQFIEYEGAEPTASDEDRVYPVSSTGLSGDSKKYYRIVTKATDERANRCWELIRSGSPLLTTYSSYSPAVGQLWTNTQAATTDAAYDYQMWAFEEDPNNPGKYALVCKALPDGSLKQNATAFNTNGYWSYDNSAKHYNFILGSGGYGAQGDKYYYTVCSDQSTSQYMNHSMSGKGYRVNCYTDPASGNGGLWTFVPTFDISDITSTKQMRKEAQTLLTKARTYTSETEKNYGAFSQETVDALNAALSADNDNAVAEALAAVKNSILLPQKDDTILIANTWDTFNGATICVREGNSNLGNTEEVFAENAWAVNAARANTSAEMSVNMRLVSATTRGRYVGSPASSATGKLGNLVNTVSGYITLTYNPEEGDFIITNAATSSSTPLRYYPISINSTSNPGTIASDANAIRPQGTGWMLKPVRLFTYNCMSVGGTNLGKKYYSCPIEELATPATPEFEGLYLSSIVNTSGNVYNLIYDDQPTGIALHTSGKAANGATYDLQGRRVSKAGKGIYVINGRKEIR